MTEISIAPGASGLALARYAATMMFFALAAPVFAAPAEPAANTPVRAPAEGGPFEAATAAATTELQADMQVRSLFNAWKKLDMLEQGTIAIPATQPVAHLAFTSNFGIRTDPFRGTAAMHAGVDIPGPVGTPVYATADGVVDRAERAGGYGNLVEIDHGKGIQTRYGHLSKILVRADGAMFTEVI